MPLCAQQAGRDGDYGATITFSSVELDYGTVMQNSDGTKEFEFTNTGKAPLIIDNVVPSCGCTVVDWPKKPIEPGKKAKLIVRYNTRIAGKFKKHIRVFSNATGIPVLLTIKGEVKPDTVKSINSNIN